MGHFKEISGAAAVMWSMFGLYREAKVFDDGQFLYAKCGSGFARLLNGGYSSTKMRWTKLIPPEGQQVKMSGKFSTPRFVE